MQTINFQKFFSGRRGEIYLGRGGKYSEGRGIKDGLVLEVHLSLISLILLALP